MTSAVVALSGPLIMIMCPFEKDDEMGCACIVCQYSLSLSLFLLPTSHILRINIQLL